MSVTSAPSADLAAVAAADHRLFERLDAWVAAAGDPGVPSRLPDWTIGHVLSHLARNADAMRRVAEGTRAGEVRPMYPSAEARAAGIEAGASRPATELVDDVRRTAAALHAAWADADWSGAGITAVGKIAATEFVYRRWREVEIHHVDLGLGYEPSDWPREFVRQDLRREEMTAKSRLPMGMTQWPPAVLALAEPVRLAWLLGRHHDPVLPELSQQ